MSKVTVQEGSTGGNPVPVAEEILKRIEDVRRRAHQFFEERQQHGSALDDWVKAEREILGLAPTELRDTKGAYQAEVALPGFATENVSVTVTPDHLIVHASKEDQQYGEDENILWSEFGSREVYRSLETPEAIDPEKTTATLDQGILLITAPKGAPKVAAKSVEAARSAKTG